MELRDPERSGEKWTQNDARRCRKPHLPVLDLRGGVVAHLSVHEPQKVVRRGGLRVGGSKLALPDRNGLPQHRLGRGKFVVVAKNVADIVAQRSV